MWSAGNRTRPRIGRPEAWQALIGRRQSAQRGKGGLTLLEGRDGVGKSTFLSLISEEAHAAGFRVATGKASRLDDPPPFRIIGDALRLIWGPTSTPMAVPPSDAAAGSGAFLPGIASEGARFAPMDPLGAMTDDAHSELTSDRLRLMGALAQPFLEAARRAPLLVILDDLSWADEASLTFLAFLLPQIVAEPIWILAGVPTRDPAEPPGADPLAAVRGRLEVDRISLRPLSEQETGEFVRWAFPLLTPEPSEVRRLHTASSGIPSQVVQLVSASQLVRPADDDADAPEGAPAPGLDRLESEARRLLHYAAVEGMEFSVGVIAPAAGLDDAQAGQYVERFVGLGIVRELDEGRYAFESDDLRQRIYAELTSVRRRILHKKIAEALERLGTNDVTTAYALARHAFLGRMDRAAVEYNQRAAAVAARAYQPRVALTYLQQALEALRRSGANDPKTELSLRLEVAVQHAHVGEPAAAGAALEEIRSSDRLWSSASPADRALLSVYRARVMADEGRWDDAERSLEEIPAGLAWEGPAELRRAALRLHGEILFYRGKYAEALSAHDAALAIARRSEAPRDVAAESIRRATALSMLPGREAEALEDFRTAIDRLVELGDAAEASFGALCLGAHLSVQGRPEEARIELQRSVVLSESAHDLRRSGWAHLNLGDLEFGLGHADAASEQLRRARECFDRVEDALGRARAALSDGRLALARGEHGGAQQDFEVARAIFADRNLNADEIEVDLRVAELELARHDSESARRRLVRLQEEGLVRLRPDLVEEGRRIARVLGPPEIAFG